MGKWRSKITSRKTKENNTIAKETHYQLHEWSIRRGYNCKPYLAVLHSFLHNGIKYLEPKGRLVTEWRIPKTSRHWHQLSPLAPFVQLRAGSTDTRSFVVWARPSAGGDVASQVGLRYWLSVRGKFHRVGPELFSLACVVCTHDRLLCWRGCWGFSEDACRLFGISVVI